MLRCLTAALTFFWLCLPAIAQDNLPITKLPPARVVPDLCLYKYRITTRSPECQAFFDQGLGYFYSYVWLEAARNFETAAKCDPDCAMAWWGLSRALDKWNRNTHTQALQKAQELLAKASHREQYLINARLQEKGLAAGVKPEDRKKTAARTLDEMLTLYDDDEEGWYNRAQLAEDGTFAKVPFYKSLLRINPLHPGANHELLHFYENIQRPALGWMNAENYIKSSPGIPHPFHMQAHLATRLGRWELTSDRSARAVEIERAYQKEMHVTPTQDYQYTHHLEILTISLVHDGRFKEARAARKDAEAAGFRHPMAWFRLHVAERDWEEVNKLIDKQRRTDKTTAAYMGAVAALRAGDLAKAKAEVESLQEAYRQKKNGELELRLWETQGTLMALTDGADAGLKLLKQAVDKTKDSFQHHAWGNGAYLMEAWGVAALRANRPEVAEEAFNEALAHDPGSVRAALGMQVLCEEQQRTEEAARYAKLARRAWQKADPGQLEAELAWLRGEVSHSR